jgi:hypothetical protein
MQAARMARRGGYGSAGTQWCRFSFPQFKVGDGLHDPNHQQLRRARGGSGFTSFWL